MAKKGTPRVQKLRRALKKSGLDGFFVCGRENTRYLTGFAGTYSVIALDSEGAWFVTDPRYGEAAEKDLGGQFEILLKTSQNTKSFWKDFLAERGWKSAGFEGSVPYNNYEMLRSNCPKLKLEEAEQLILELRARKDEAELAAIRKAVRLADRIMKRAIAMLRPGLSEAEVSRQIRFWAEEMGGVGESFPNIVAAGRNSSRPHHHPGKKKLKAGDPVTIDLGVIADGYCSDLTRTVALGQSAKEFEHIYEVCLAANEAAIAAIKPGMTGAQADAKARAVIEEAGYGEFFGHGLGHGVGVEIHEAPRLAPSSEQKLYAGNVVTIEPGIYVPRKFGVRIEDYAVLVKGGAEVLSQAPKRLKKLRVD